MCGRARECGRESVGEMREIVWEKECLESEEKRVCGRESLGDNVWESVEESVGERECLDSE